MSKKAKKSKPKRKPPKPDFSQNALAGVEKLIGGKLGDGMSKKTASR
jgi:hypothetical protein